MKLNWGHYIFIFIILFLSLCTIFIIFAVRQNNDLVDDNYYELGAGYTAQMKITERSEVFSDSIEVKVLDSYLLLRLPASVFRNTGTVSAYFYRPSGKKDDFSGEYGITGDSVIIDRELLVRGRYILSIGWILNDEKFLIKKDLFIE